MLTLTVSSIQAFLRCPRYWRNRYLDEIVLTEFSEAQPLFFGTAIHKALAELYASKSKDKALAQLSSLQGTDLVKARAMIEAYWLKWGVADMNVVSVEQEFVMPLVNPQTGRPSQLFRLAGKMDAVIASGSKLVLVEHKTASKISETYFEALWQDLQLYVYAHALEEQEKISRGDQTFTVDKALYDVLIKPTIIQRGGESFEEYQTRKRALEAKSGKPSKAQQQIAESDDDYLQRCRQWYAERDDALVRSDEFISRDAMIETRSNIWYIGQTINNCKNQGWFPKNTGSCMGRFGNERCQYYDLCQHNDDRGVKENFYTNKDAHEELTILKNQDGQKDYTFKEMTACQ